MSKIDCLSLRAFSSHSVVTIYGIAGPRQDIANYEERYTTYVGFNLYDDGDADDDRDCIKGDIVATVGMLLFNESLILNERADIPELAGRHDIIASDAMSALLKSKIYKYPPCDEKESYPLFSSYLERVYVYPDLRGQGVAPYIFDNLEQIVLHCFNVNLGGVVTIPWPQQPDTNGNWIDSPDDDGTMLKKMTRTIKKAGYRRLGKSDFFAINYSVV